MVKKKQEDNKLLSKLFVMDINKVIIFFSIIIVVIIFFSIYNNGYVKEYVRNPTIFTIIALPFLGKMLLFPMIKLYFPYFVILTYYIGLNISVNYPEIFDFIVDFPLALQNNMANILRIMGNVNSSGLGDRWGELVESNPSICDSVECDCTGDAIAGC